MCDVCLGCDCSCVPVSAPCCLYNQVIKDNKHTVKHWTSELKKLRELHKKEADDWGLDDDDHDDVTDGEEEEGDDVNGAEEVKGDSASEREQVIDSRRKIVCALHSRPTCLECTEERWVGNGRVGEPSHHVHIVR